MDKLVKTKTGKWQTVDGTKVQAVAAPVVSAMPISTTKTLPNQNIESLLSGVNLSALQPEQKQKLRKAIQIYQQGVRSKIDTYLQLQRPVDEGGFGLSETVADEIMSRIKIDATKSKYPTLAPRESTISSDRAVKFTNAIKTQTDLQEKVELETPTKEEIVNPPKTGRLVTDVKSYPKVVGPIEELRILTTKDFRRFDSNPDKALQVVERKLNLLKEDSYEDYVKGVAAWRQSPLYQSYIKLVEDSLHSGRAISETVAAAKQTDLHNLSWTEFVAIRQFNSTL